MSAPFVAPASVPPRETRAQKKARKRRERPPLPAADRSRRLGLIAISGILTFLSFPFTPDSGLSLWPLAWLSLVPLFEGLRGLRGKQAFWYGAFGGFVTNFGGFWWISEVLREFGHLPPYAYVPMAALNAFYQGLTFAIVGLCIARAGRNRPHGLVPIWQMAAIYTVVEWLFPMIFPWYFANSQYRFLPAIQIAEIGGVMSITFVMIAFNAALHRLWVHIALWSAPATGPLSRPRLPRRALIATFVGTALVLIYGQIRIGMVEADIAAADKVKLGLVEADIGIFEKQAKHLPARQQALTLHRNLLKHQTMSAELERLGVDLVVWPESSYFPLDDPFIKRTDRMALGLGLNGELMEWVYELATDSFVWRPVGGGEAAAGKASAIAVMREDLFVTLSAPSGLSGGASLPPGEYSTVALATAPGYSPREDHAKAMIWVGGKDGLAVGRFGERLTKVPAVLPHPVNAIAMRTGRDGVAVGDGGMILEIEKEIPRQVETPITNALRAVAWQDGSNPLALAVGDHGTLAVRIDRAWQIEQLPGDLGDIALTAVAFDRNGAPWVGGQGGFVATRTDGVWHPAILPNKRDVLSLAIDPLGALLVADADGIVWRRATNGTQWEQVGQGVMRIASADWVQAMPLPRDVRWVRQSSVPLPALADFDANPNAEIGGVAEADRTGLQRGFTTPLLLGGLTWAPPLPGKERRQLFNTALMVNQRGRILGTYDKVYLLAFGEYMPFGDTFPELQDMFPQAGRFSAGSEVRTFAWRGHKIGIMICYEDIMVDFTGKLADLSPNVIINVTNDAWFGRTAEPWLHLALAAFRAVENRLSLVRATNTGVSAFIDPTGRLTGATRLDDPEILVEDVPMMVGGTVYGTVGNLFAWLLLAALVAHVALGYWRRRQASMPKDTST